MSTWNLLVYLRKIAEMALLLQNIDQNIDDEVFRLAFCHANQNRVEQRDFLSQIQNDYDANIFTKER